MKIGLIPLDERPVNVRYPALLAKMADAVDVVLPPPDVLSHRRQPADTDKLAAWLREFAPSLDVLIVSVEMLGYGGLIASRITDDDALAIYARLDVLREIRAAYPNLKLWLFNVITRISDADNNVEEPLYWDTYGVRLHRYSQAMHRADAPIIAELESQIPAEHIADFTRRRLRNHQVNLRVLEGFVGGLYDLLVLSSDDTSEYGYGTQEKAWLTTWMKRLKLDSSRFLMYPGADEVGCVLLARAALNGRSPRFAVRYAIEADKARIAPYEDAPVSITVERQIRAIGGQIVADLDGADFIVAVNPPSRIGVEFDPEPEHVNREREIRSPHLTTFTAHISDWIDDGRRVILCDVAYPNGSDPFLIERLLDSVDITRLSAYGAWNTAGNTIGTALAQGIFTAMATTPEQIEAASAFMLHRFIEDWGYQHIVRQVMRDWLEETTGVRDTQADNIAQTIERIEAQLNDVLARITAYAGSWRIVAGSVRLPWRRTFEVDFDLERRP
ncbi:MAG: DUF4127 family protein [Anaerolineaceae bacterium]|nr:MAG: DUF4127 family protein [Anaerolineaceae bacterium]